MLCKHTYFFQLTKRKRQWEHFVRLLSPTEFLNLCDECYSRWELPRNGGWQIHARKHGIEACMIAVLGILATGMCDLTMEAVAQMSHGLINIEFERVLCILDEVLDDEMWLLTEEEKEVCKNSCRSDPNAIYIIDGCDIAVEEKKNAWMWKTHKDNVKSNRAARAQILVDT